MIQMMSSAQARAGCRVAQAGFEMRLCNKMMSRQMIGHAQHRFSACHVVALLRFKSHFLSSRGDVERAVNVGCPTRIQVQSVQKHELAGKVLTGVPMLMSQSDYRPLCPGLQFVQYR